MSSPPPESSQATPVGADVGPASPTSKRWCAEGSDRPRRARRPVVRYTHPDEYDVLKSFDMLPTEEEVALLQQEMLEDNASDGESEVSEWVPEDGTENSNASEPLEFAEGLMDPSREAGGANPDEDTGEYTVEEESEDEPDDSCYGASEDELSDSPSVDPYMDDLTGDAQEATSSETTGGDEAADPAPPPGAALNLESAVPAVVPATVPAAAPAAAPAAVPDLAGLGRQPDT